MNYLDVPFNDVQYMNKHLCNATKLGETSLLQQIDQANLDLLFMAGTSQRGKCRRSAPPSGRPTSAIRHRLVV